MMIIGKRVSNFIIIPLHTYYIYYKKIAWKYRTQAPNTKYASLSAGGTGGTRERYKIQIRPACGYEEMESVLHQVLATTLNLFSPTKEADYAP